MLLFILQRMLRSATLKFMTKAARSHCIWDALHTRISTTSEKNYPRKKMQEKSSQALLRFSTICLMTRLFCGAAKKAAAAHTELAVFQTVHFHPEDRATFGPARIMPISHAHTAHRGFSLFSFSLLTFLPHLAAPSITGRGGIAARRRGRGRDAEAVSDRPGMACLKRPPRPRSAGNPLIALLLLR